MCPAFLHVQNLPHNIQSPCSVSIRDKVHHRLHNLDPLKKAPISISEIGIARDISAFYTILTG